MQRFIIETPAYRCGRIWPEYKIEETPNTDDVTVEKNKAIAEIRDILEQIAWAPVPGPTGRAILVGFFLLALVLIILDTISIDTLKPVPVRFWLPSCTGVVLLMVLCAWLDHRTLKRYRAWVEQRIHESGIFERLAMDWEYVAEIYKYTPFPWKLMLWPRPRSLRRAISLLTSNLPWYLTDPHTYINRFNAFTLAYLCLAPVIVGFTQYQSCNMRASLNAANPGQWMTVASQGHWLTVVYMALTISFMWLGLLYTHRSKINAELLLEELRKRIK